MWFHEAIGDKPTVCTSVAVHQEPHEDRRRVGVTAAFNRRDQLAHPGFFQCAQGRQERGKMVPRMAMVAAGTWTRSVGRARAFASDRLPATASP